MDFEIKNGILMKCIGNDSDVVIPEGVTRIEQNAFAGLRGCTDLFIPDSLQTIAPYAFNDYDLQFKAVHVSSLEIWMGIKMEGIRSNPMVWGADLIVNGQRMESLVIPCEATSVGMAQFMGCLSLTSIDISEGITAIERDAFASCENVVSVRLPASLCEIGERAFYNCKRLQSVRIPDSVVRIRPSAFMKCKELSQVKLPQSLTMIEDELFRECTSLTSIDLPDTVTAIGNSAFWGCGISSITIPNAVQVIGENAFACTALQEVSLPEGVITIQAHAFENCGSLTSVSLPKSLKTIGAMAFAGNEKLETVDIKDLLSWLQIDMSSKFNSNLRGYDEPSQGIRFLFGGKELTELIIPLDIDTIPRNAFSECRGLREIVIPAHVKRIGDAAFRNCPNLRRVEIQGETEIGSYAFAYCRQLEEVKVSDDVPVIGASAFKYCLALSEISIPSGIIILEESVFSNCKKLNDITLPNGLQKIKSFAFCGCESLSSMDIPQSVRVIGGSVFARCTNLKSIRLPDGLETISVSLFKGTSMEAIELPEGVKEIDVSAFAECKNLAEINIPATVEDVHPLSFEESPNIVKLVIKCNLDAFDRDTFRSAKQKKDVCIAEDQLEKAKRLFKFARFFNLDGQPIVSAKKNPTVPKKKAPVKNNLVPDDFAADQMKVVYSDGSQPDNGVIQPIIMSAGKPKGFAKPAVKEAQVLVGGEAFTVVFKIAGRLPGLWKQYYLTKEDGDLFDPRTAVFYSEPGAEYLELPIRGEIPTWLVPLSADEVEKRLCAFVKASNICVREENVKAVLEQAAKKKNGRLSKGRVVHLAYLDLVGRPGTTYELVARNDDETRITIELRKDVMVTDELLQRKHLLQQNPDH